MKPDKPAEVLINTMPPNSTLKPNIVDVFVRWIKNGMPQTKDEAAAKFVVPTPKATATP
jgi:hypothetical protein